MNISGDDNKHLKPRDVQLFEEWVNQIKSLRDPSISRDVLTHIYIYPNYFLDYKFKPWQLVAYPVVTTNFFFLRKKLHCNLNFGSAEWLKAEALVSELEFGKYKNCLGFLDRQRIRKAVYIHQIDAWRLRQAFNSFAAKSYDKQIQYRPQPTWILPIATSIQYFLGFGASSFFLVLCYDAFVDRIIFFNLAWPNLLEQLAIIGTFVMHKLGRQWKIGNDVFQTLKI